jgi:hypothetical protein
MTGFLVIQVMRQHRAALYLSVGELQALAFGVLDAFKVGQMSFVQYVFSCYSMYGMGGITCSAVNVPWGYFGGCVCQLRGCGLQVRNQR